jgi:hypothetical protein
VVHCQDSGGDDGSSGGDDGSDSAGSDPSMINPPNSQGYGKDVKTTLVKTKPMKSTPQIKTLAEQSVLAVFQFAVLVIIFK